MPESKRSIVNYYAPGSIVILGDNMVIDNSRTIINSNNRTIMKHTVTNNIEVKENIKRTNVTTNLGIGDSVISKIINVLMN